MLRFVVWRLVQLPIILLVIFVVTFSLAWLVPGSPLERPEGRRPSPEVIEAMEKRYNLDSPLAFAGGYLERVLLHADFGPSLHYPEQKVADIVGAGLPVSATLGVAALIVALALGLVAGIIGALRPGSVLDLSSLAAALVGVSLPTFVTGAALLVVFAGLLPWLPVGGWFDWPDLRFWSEGWSDYYGRGDLTSDLFKMAKHLVLPAITLGAAPAAYIARLIRLGLADVMSSDFIRTARAKGLSVNRALFRHALKVAFLPVLSFLGPAAAATMTGSFVVEKVFAIPGLGEHFVNAVLNKDQFLLLGVVLIYSTMLVVFNLIVDVAYAWVDPRIELA